MLQRIQNHWHAWQLSRHRIDPTTWARVLREQPYLPRDERLKDLASLFLRRKQFTAAGGLVFSDHIACTIAAQACLPILRMPSGRLRNGKKDFAALAWYDDFVNIVVHPAEVVAPRKTPDAGGLVHEHHEVLLGEAMQGGPVTLSWQHVQSAASSTRQGQNLVIHEFVHKIDMRKGDATGTPALPAGFMGTTTGADAIRLWQRTITGAFERFQDQITLAQNFGQSPPWLDAYGATSLVEFFPVSAEAYFSNRPQFAQDFADLLPMYDAFFGAPAGPFGR
jgi:Mlc titration factor MtfA (ptsG expression regulator)